jgi:hypothetical protein
MYDFIENQFSGRLRISGDLLTKDMHFRMW